MLKTRPIRRFRKLEKLESHAVTMLCAIVLNVFFLSIPFQKAIVLFEKDIWLLFSQISIG